MKIANIRTSQEYTGELAGSLENGKIVQDIFYLIISSLFSYETRQAFFNFSA